MFTRILVLTWADFLAIYVMWMMMIYLTDVWKISFTHAAGIINVFVGAVFIMPLFMQFVVESFLGHFWMLLLSSLAYCVGLGFLTMSTPPVLGSCSEYKPECIGREQDILYYMALALIAVGMSGHLVSLGTFMAQQFMNMLEERLNFRFFCTTFLAAYASTIFLIAAVIAIPYIHPWSIRFGIPAIFTLAATLIFLTGCCSYNYVKADGSPLTILLRVLVASASKLFHRRPKDPNQLYEIRNANLVLLPHTRSLRCLDKAAIILPDQTLEEQQKNRWRLCRLLEVEITKMTLRMVPIWMTYIMLGVVSSMAYTYFVEQAKHMNHKVGRLTIPLPIFLWFYLKAKEVSSKFNVIISSCFGCLQRYTAPFGMALSMIFAILCCITAARVENRRLDVVTRHDLINKPDERIPMTVFWLLPQFILLGAMDGLFETSASLFMVDHIPQSWTGYMALFTLAVYGLGYLGSSLSVYIVGKVSERGGKPSWFQETLNKSRLDKYYWTLAWLVAINLGVYILVAIWYNYNVSHLADDEEEQEEPVEPFEDDAQCCC